VEKILLTLFDNYICDWQVEQPLVSSDINKTKIITPRPRPRPFLLVSDRSCNNTKVSDHITACDQRNV